MTLPNLAVLEKKCQQLNLTVRIAGKKPQKSDYVAALRQHFMPVSGLPYVEVDPMLCFAIWNLKPEEQQKVWTSPSWVAQRKLNGCRLILHFVKGVGVFAHSRTVSVKTFRFEELTSKLLLSEVVPDFSATVDAEIMITKPVDTRPYTAKGQVTQSSLHSTTAVLHLASESARQLQREQDAEFQYHVFDAIRFEGQDLRGMPLSRRIEFVELFKQKIVGMAHAAQFQFPEFVRDDRMAYFQSILKEGGEGVILKSLNSRYVDSSSRDRNAWVKAKKRIEFDAYVSGFNRGKEEAAWVNLVGDLEFSVMTEKGPHMIGRASNLDFEFRKAISQYDAASDTVSLRADIYGKVAEISGQDVTPRVLRLSHCTIDRWRDQTGDEKSKEQCVVKMGDLIQAAEWVD